MVVTRASAKARVMSESDLESFSTPRKHLPTPPRRIPASASRFICQVCKSKDSYSSTSKDFNLPKVSQNVTSEHVTILEFNDFNEQVNHKFSEIKLLIDNINEQVSTIVKSMILHKNIISNLEKEVADLANSQSLSTHSTPSPLTTNSHSLVPPSKPPPTSVLSPPARPATYWRSAPSSRRTFPLPRSSMPRHLAPPEPSPFPLSSPQTANSRSFPPAPSSYRSAHSNARVVVAKRSRSENHITSKKNSILILGDSNTRHVRLSNSYNIHRVPTFLIQDIDPALCKGYSRVWIHCGINNLKYNRCNTYSDVEKIFKTFMNKLGAIRNLCPETKIYVSPILPCAIPGLNDRAAQFNSLLFSVRNIWWSELKFNNFCCRETGMLARQFRSFKNRGDKIHLGMRGINALEHALLCELNKVNGRLYSAVVINH